MCQFFPVYLMSVVVRTIQKWLAVQDMGNIFHHDFVSWSCLEAVALGCSQQPWLEGHLLHTLAAEPLESLMRRVANSL